MTTLGKNGAICAICAREAYQRVLEARKPDTVSQICVSPEAFSMLWSGHKSRRVCEIRVRQSSAPGFASGARVRLLETRPDGTRTGCALECFVSSVVDDNGVFSIQFYVDCVCLFDALSLVQTVQIGRKEAGAGCL